MKSFPIMAFKQSDIIRLSTKDDVNKVVWIFINILRLSIWTVIRWVVKFDDYEDKDML